MLLYDVETCFFVRFPNLDLAAPPLNLTRNISQTVFFLHDTMPITPNTTLSFVLHQVDRDPENGLYSGNRILIEGKGDFEIVKYDIKTGDLRIRTCTFKPIFFHVKISPEAKSNMDLFKRDILRPWRECYSPSLKNSEDYTDYLPAYYETLQDLAEEKSHIVHDDDPLHTEDGG
jgi:hypothetical protein